MTSSGRALGWSALIALAVVVVDQLTKQWALSALDDRNIDLVWTLRLNLVLNSGMAFGQADGWGPVIGVVAIGVIVVLLVSLRTGTGWLGTIGVGLVVGGALGNLLDRLFRGDGWLRGPVVDFIDFQWFPVFNIADIAINVGAGLLILGAVLSDRRRRADEEATDDVAGSDAAPETVE